MWSFSKIYVGRGLGVALPNIDKLLAQFSVLAVFEKKLNYF